MARYLNHGRSISLVRKTPQTTILSQEQTIVNGVKDVSTTSCSDVQALCATGVRSGGICDPDVKYHVPSGGEASFYTTWSFYLCLIAVFFLACYLTVTATVKVGSGASVGIRNFKEKVLLNPVFQLVAITLIAMPFINSIGVLFTSQMLLAKNFKLGQASGSDVVCPKLTDEPKSITTGFFSKTMDINLVFHIVPAIIAVAGLLLLSLNRTGRTLFRGKEVQGGRGWKWNLALAALIFVYNLVFIGLYLAVPADGKFGIDKVDDVYNDPPNTFFVAQLAIVLLLCFTAAFGLV